MPSQRSRHNPHPARYLPEVLRIGRARRRGVRGGGVPAGGQAGKETEEAQVQVADLKAQDNVNRSRRGVLHASEIHTLGKKACEENKSTCAQWA